ncbi:MAG TPA: methylmalonyl-CoA epimerase [Caldithrix abyssi]|uniref:Methylmalonyl-CoA epimerase n=1 Tax=Caldithrix abyssi TaxID=187145 RepID=A0A7V5UFJ8_CALAY|nr:methylmalonyl-CoA epimerase [Caldithrix abyssi]
MITKINHIAIAVESLDEAIPYYRDVLGLELIATEEVPDQKVRVAMFRVGEVRIELLEPAAPDSPVAKYLAKNGPGLHHLAFETDDIRAELEHLDQHQIELIDKQPKPGAHGTRIAFLHPRSTGRVLTELCQVDKNQ